MKPEELSDMFPVDGGTLELRYRLPGQLGGGDSLRFIVLLDKVALAGFAAAVQPDPPVQGREFPHVSNVSVMCEGVLIPVRCPPDGEPPVDIAKLIANTREQMRIGWEPYVRPTPKAPPED